MSKDVKNAFESLLNELLSKKEKFHSIFADLNPVIHSKSEFFIAFFLGYIAHSYKELFLDLTDRDMKYDEIVETLQFLMSRESRIRDVLVSMYEKGEIEGLHEREIYSVESEKAKTTEVLDKVSNLEQSIQTLRLEMDRIKSATENAIKRYEIKLVKRGEFKKSILG